MKFLLLPCVLLLFLACRHNPTAGVDNKDVLAGARVTSDSITKKVNTSGSQPLQPAQPNLENPLFAPESLNIPVLRIQTSNSMAVDSKDTYVEAQLSLEEGGGIAPLQLALSIRGRGNSTWNMPKKPYKLKFPAKTALLNMPADKEWVLLANYSDKTLLRTSLGFEMGRRFGLAYSPRSRYVELFINGAYLGTYQLTENIKISKSRVDIKDLKADTKSASDISGGYLLELDQRRDGTQIIETAGGLPFVLHEPDPATDEQRLYVSTLLQQVENNVIDSVDIDSFIGWYLVQELARNNDAAGFSSMWLFKPQAAQLKMGPLWDFDIGFGNINHNGCDNPVGWYIQEFIWYKKLFADPVFSARVRSRWKELKATAIDTLPAFIDQTAASLSVAQHNNFSRWLILNTQVWPNPIVTGSYEGEISALKTWLTARIAWMDSQLNP